MMHSHRTHLWLPECIAAQINDAAKLFVDCHHCWGLHECWGVSEIPENACI